MEGLRYLLVALVARSAAACELTGPLDLGRTLSTDAINSTFPFTQGTVREGSYRGVRYLINNFCVGEHTGTHLDAPYHFNDSGWKLDEIPLNRLIGNGVFLNVTEEAAGNVSFRLQSSHIDRWIEQHGTFPPNAVLLISYGWAQFYPNKERYMGTASGNFDEFQFPGMSTETANRLFQIEQLVGIGVDTPSLDASDSANAHVILAARNIYNLEQVNLDQPCLPARGFKVYSMPVNVAGGTGAPTRVVAVPNNPT